MKSESHNFFFFFRLYTKSASNITEGLSEIKTHDSFVMTECSKTQFRLTRPKYLLNITQARVHGSLIECSTFYCEVMIWAPSSEFVSSSIPSWQIVTAHVQPLRGARDLAFCVKVPLDSLLVWASSGGSGETVRMRRLAWTFAARISDKYQIRLTQSIYWFEKNKTKKKQHWNLIVIVVFYDISCYSFCCIWNIPNSISFTRSFLLLLGPICIHVLTANKQRKCKTSKEKNRKWFCWFNTYYIIWCFSYWKNCYNALSEVPHDRTDPDPYVSQTLFKQLGKHETYC